MRHFLNLFDVASADIEQIFAFTKTLKTELAAGVRRPVLAGRMLAMVFEKPSLRTRVSFATGMTHLGGASEYLGQEAGWGKRESVADFSGVLSEMVDVIVCRTKDHRRVEELAASASCPVINGLTDLYHPCQALADLYTLQEHVADLSQASMAYIGDANNVAGSLAIACAKMGVRLSIASPEGYTFSDDFREKLRQASPDFKLLETADPQEAVQNADAVYTDVWASMGQEAEQAERAQAFASYQLNAELMRHAPDNAIVLHCLPARRGEEISDEVIDGRQSAVIQQAGNRLHAQKGLLVWLLNAMPA